MGIRQTPLIVEQIQNTEQLSVDYSYQKSISYSQFSTYLSCPKKWELQYKQKVPVSNVSVNFSFGTAIHEVLQHYLDVLYNQSAPEADELDLETIFEETLSKEYKKAYEQNDKVHFSSPGELTEFYEDGIEIIRYFKDHRRDYFDKKDQYLVGCEIPIVIIPNIAYSNVIYKGYLDVVMYDESTNIFRIIDLKTSTRGWTQDNKSDEAKQFQLIFYKKYFAEQYNVPEDNIEVEFIILKRKVYESKFEATQNRIQTFSPASGKIKTKRATTLLTSFIEDVFEANGALKDKSYKANVSKGCKYCPFYKKKEYCSES
jgi:RecB family exonuclease